VRAIRRPRRGQPFTFEVGGVDEREGQTFCSQGVCRPFCAVPGDLCDAGYCQHSVSIAVCFSPCDPLVPSCATGEGCFLPTIAPAAQSPGCAPAGAAQLGDACVQPHDCAAGMTCTTVNGVCVLV
jgi:hypothetical protein